MWGYFVFYLTLIKINRGTLINALTIKFKKHIIIKERYLPNKEKVPH